MARTAANPGAENASTPIPNDPVAEGQAGDPGVPEALDKNGPADDITAPGEAIAGEVRVKVKATGKFLVHDPYTLDVVGADGGEMRMTSFVQEKLDEGKLKKM